VWGYDLAARESSRKIGGAWGGVRILPRQDMSAYREPKKMTTSRRKIDACEESRRLDREAIALLAGDPITAESLAAAYRVIFDSKPVARQGTQQERLKE
jgi:hypothetical protein